MTRPNGPQRPGAQHDPEFEEQLWERLRTELARARAAQATKRRLPLLRLAAGFLVLASLATLFFLQRSPDPLQDRKTATGGPPSLPATSPDPAAPGLAADALPEPAHRQPLGLPLFHDDEILELDLAFESAAGTRLEFAALELVAEDASGRVLATKGVQNAALRAESRWLPDHRLQVRVAAESLPAASAALRLRSSLHGAHAEDGHPWSFTIPVGAAGAGTTRLNSGGQYSYGTQVVDAVQGQPIAGALVQYVTAQEAREYRSGAMPPPCCPAEFTDADGRFVGLTQHSGEHLLLVARPGHLPVQLGGVRPDLQTGLPARLALHLGRTLSGSVASESGAPLAGVLLQVRGGQPTEADLINPVLGARAWQTVKSDSGGAYSVSGLQFAAASATLLEVAVGGLAHDPAPLAPPQVWMDEQTLRTSSARATSGVAPSAPTRGAVPGPYATRLRLPLPPQGEMLDLQLRFEELWIRAYDHNGRPEPDAQFRLVVKEPGGQAWRTGVHAATQAGEFLVMPDTALRISAWTPDGRETAQLEIRAPAGVGIGQTGLDLHDGSLATIDFVLEDPAGRPVLGARWGIDGDAIPQHRVELLTSPPGAAPGEYRLTLPSGLRAIHLYGPPDPAGGLTPYGFRSETHDLLPGTTLDLGRLELSRGNPIEVRVPLDFHLGDAESMLTETLGSKRWGRVRARFGPEGGALQPVALQADPDPTWMQRQPTDIDPTDIRSQVRWSETEQDWFRSYYLRQRPPAGRYEIELDVLDSHVDLQSIQLDGSDSPVVVTLQGF